MIRETYVYFIATADRARIKIGWSYRPEARLSTLMRLSPYPLELIATAPASLEDERAIHAAFLIHHSHREWFVGHPDILAAAAFINKTGNLPDHLRGMPGQRRTLGRAGASNRKLKDAA